MKQLMFDLNEINRPLPILAKLLRIIFFRRSITNDDFVQKHTEWYVRMNLTPAARNHDRNNFRRTISSNVDETLTWNTFAKAIINILHLDILEVAITVRDPSTGEVSTYTSNDLIQSENSDTGSQMDVK